MQFQYIPYIWPLAFSAFASLVLGIHTLLRRRNAKGATSFIVSMIVVTIWSSANALEMAAMDLPSKLFWANVQYFAYCYSPVTLLVLCMEFTGYDHLIRNRKFIWLAVIPTIIIVLVWTDSLHGLIRYNIYLDYSGSFPVINKKYGPIFYIHALYSHLLNISAGVLLIRRVLLKSTVYRKQALSLLLGLSLIVLPNIMYVLDISPIKKFDITPMFFAPAGFIAAWGIFRYKLFDVVPIAWATAIRNMDARIIVLDLQDRVLEINPSFEKMVGCTAAAASTKTLEEVCSNMPELVNACLDKDNTHREFSINRDGVLKIYEVLISPIKDSSDMLIGRLAVIHNITKKKQEQQEYFRQKWKEAVIKERERYARDMHDNLGQVLGFISLQAQGIKQELMKSGVDIVSLKLDKLVAVAQSSNNDIREYIRNARNENAEEEDFITALKQNIFRFEEQTGIKTKLDISFELSWEQLSPNIRVNILNIIKESMNNIIKYAEADNVFISFSLVQEQLYIKVEDDGKGFDIEQSNNGTKTKFGLKIMRERALEIGAQLDIQSVAGQGSRISLCIPIKEEGKNAEESDAT